MGNIIQNEDIKNKSEVVIEDVKPKNSRISILLIIFISLFLITFLALSFILIRYKPDFLKIFQKKEIIEEEFVNTENKEEETTYFTGEGTITGTLSYPSESLPSLKVCAVNTVNKKETCIQTSEDDDKYTITVQAGKYLVYVSDKYSKAYYTECDTYSNPSEDPRCNSNYNESNGSWNSEDFICFEDTTCKSAFTPLAITVEDKQAVTLPTIIQGWYIPCSYDLDTCNDPNFDEWNDYLE